MATPCNAIWLPGDNPPIDQRVGFRARFHLDRETTVTVRSMACGWFLAWLDGRPFLEGPARYLRRKPEHSEESITIPAGEHVIAVLAQNVGVETRQLEAGPPFLMLDLLADRCALEMQWRACELDAYLFGARRVSCLLSWIDWCDTRRLPRDWQGLDFDDSAWSPAARVDSGLPASTPARLGPVGMFEAPVEAMARGVLSEEFGYELDDPPMRFLLRDLAPEAHPAQGAWRRYELGRVRLGRPRFVMDLPQGAVVEFGLADHLHSGRVAPVISLSGSPTANMDHFVARGGAQEFLPLTPKGGRFLEVHVIAPPGSALFLEERFLERCYHPPSEAAFECDDDLLNRVWHVGVETYRACSEDALDEPVRERGQWTGDAVSPGLEIAASAYSDLRLVRRSLQHAADCARSDGLVAAMCPGGTLHMTSYAAQWVQAHWRYFELTGEEQLLHDNFDAMVANFEAFEPFWTPEGYADGLADNFIDWGYARNEGPVDIALNIHLLGGLRAAAKWSAKLGKGREATRFADREGELASALSAFLRRHAADAEPFASMGYHVAVLALLHGLVPEDSKAPCIEAIKSHQRRCFPNNPAAPRLSDPTVQGTQFITPYFLHFALDALLREGETRHVLDQIRTCYGWALGGGRTTWVEVFDTRWSHCHQWSGCPTWLLSRHILGLHPRFDIDGGTFDFHPMPGGLLRATGRVPLGGTWEFVEVEWQREGDRIVACVRAPRPITLRLAGASAGEAGVVRVDGSWQGVVPVE